MDVKQLPEMEEDIYKTKRWFLNNKLHREGGPAVEYTGGAKFWYLDGRCHRVDGPAMENADGSKFWYIHGEHLTLMEFINHELVTEEVVQDVLTKWM